MRTLKNNQTLRLLGIFGISLLTMLVIVGGSTIIHRGFPPFATTAHAATVNSCATTKGTQPALCERQDPIVQGCVTDAQTLDLQTVFQDRLQTRPLGEVELRYSPTCKASWIRTTAFVTTTGSSKRSMPSLYSTIIPQRISLEHPSFPVSSLRMWPGQT